MNKYHRTAISTLPSNGWVRSIAHAWGMLALCTIACAAGAADLIAVYREAQSQDAAPSEVGEREEDAVAVG